MRLTASAPDFLSVARNRWHIDATSALSSVCSLQDVTDANKNTNLASRRYPTTAFSPFQWGKREARFGKGGIMVAFFAKSVQ